MVHNFYAGPSILRPEVIKGTQEAIMNFDNLGLSILEISHRSPSFDKVMKEVKALIIEIAQVPEDYEVLFLTGGASSQFYMVPMNILNKNETAGYLDTGTWSTKAIKEANHFGKTSVLASSKDKNYTYVPKGYEIPSDLKYIHYTSNNTIFGTRVDNIQTNGNHALVCDMSSDIFSKPINVSNYDIIYAGAQKNIGPAGVTLAIIKKEILGKVDRAIPTMLNYETHIAKNSMFNTPPVLPIYSSLLTLRWIKEFGGLEKMEKRNTDKASLLYNEIDRNKLFNANIKNVEDRSKMNVTFSTKSNELESKFHALCQESNIVGIKGHRSVGGFRASIYNAMDIKSVEVLVDAMKKFEQRNG